MNLAGMRLKADIAVAASIGLAGDSAKGSMSATVSGRPALPSARTYMRRQGSSSQLAKPDLRMVLNSSTTCSDSYHPT